MRVTSVVLVGVYIPYQANARTAINNLAASINATENADPDSIVLALSVFNHTNLRKALPKYKQHVKCLTRDDKTLDNCYCTILNALHAVPQAPLGRSDHAMVYLIPTYLQKLKSDKPLKKTVKKWTQEAILSLRGCFDHTDWATFSKSCANQDEYADTVTSYVSFCTDSCIPSKTVTIYANDKPWFSNDIKHTPTPAPAPKGQPICSASRLKEFYNAPDAFVKATWLLHRMNVFNYYAPYIFC